MPQSYVNYTGTGSAATYTVPFPYLERSHVSAELGGAPLAFTWISSTQVQVNAPNGSTFTLRRTTPTGAPVVNYQDGSVIGEVDLDTSALQTLYATQELEDKVADLESLINDLTLSAGAVPVPSSPADDGRVLQASGGSYSWVTFAASMLSGVSAWALSFLGLATAGDGLAALGGVPTSRTISAGTGLSGGGSLSANRTLSLADSGVTAGSYNVANIAVDAKGRVTAASAATIGSGLELVGSTLQAQNASTKLLLAGSTFSLANNTETAVAFDFEQWDDAGWHDNVTNKTRVTVNFTGRVQIVAYCFFPLAAAAVARIQLYKNGVTAGQPFQNFEDSAASTSLNAVIELECSPGDYFEMKVLQNSGAAVNVTPQLTVTRIK